MNRRGFLLGAGALVAAPAIVRAESIMRIAPVLQVPVRDHTQDMLRFWRERFDRDRDLSAWTAALEESVKPSGLAILQQHYDARSRGVITIRRPAPYTYPNHPK